MLQVFRWVGLGRHDEARQELIAVRGSWLRNQALELLLQGVRLRRRRLLRWRGRQVLEETHETLLLGRLLLGLGAWDLLLE